LVGEVRDQRYLPVGERADLLPEYIDRSDQLALLEHRNDEKGSSTAKFDGSNCWRFALKITLVRH